MRPTARLIALALFLASAPLASAQPDATGEQPASSASERRFGFEFEFAGRGNRIARFEEMPWENYERLMREVVLAYGGDPSEIQRIDFTKPTSNLERFPTGERALFRAEWTDPQGRTWKIEPEYVATTGLDGYELVTPPINDPNELKSLLDRIRDSGIVREGLKSGVHLTLDGTGLVRSNGDARALANLIMMHENNEPMLRRLFNPVRGGGHANRFARSIAMDHPDLLAEIEALAPEERTRERLSEIFRAREGREAELHGIDPMDPEARSKLWKYRSMNLAKALDINELHNGSMGVVEFRMFDLHALADPEVHRLEARLYQAMVDRAIEMAERGETVRYVPRAPQPAGEDPAIYNTPQDPREAKAKAREMIESFGLDPAEFEPLLERNVARHRAIPTESEFRRAFNALPTGRVEHNGKPFTYGFELEGSGEGFARIARPRDAEVNARWDGMSDAEKLAYYREVVGNNRRAVSQHFDVDLQRFPWIDPSWKVEYTGNWEIRSVPFESLAEATARMREVRSLTGQSAKGFHLHMRDNGVDWEGLRARGSELADFIERSANWVWLERAKRLQTMTAIKSWSNARMTVGDVEDVSQLRSSDRATVRVTVPSNREYIDLEIRGFTLFVDDIERLGKIYTEALRTQNFGPWRHTENPLPNGGGWGDAPESLRFVDHMERYMREVEGKEMTPELREVLEGLQHRYPSRAKGDPRALPTNVATPLLPWDRETSLDESLRRELRFRQEDYLRSLRALANQVMNGQYGLDLAVASAEGLVRHLGITPAEAEALVAYRRAGGRLETPEDVVRALSRGVEGGRMARLSAFDLASGDLSDGRFGLSSEEVRRVTEYRDAVDVIDALQRSGVSEAAVLDMIDRSSGLDLGTAEATAERIAERLGISLEAAERIVAYRDAHELRGEADLRSAGLSAEEASRVLARAGAASLDLATASRSALIGAGIEAELADRLLRYRDAHRVGRGSYTWADYEPDRAARELREAGLLSPEEAERVRRFSESSPLETASAETLRDRYGLEAEVAERVVRLRDAHSVSNAAELVRAGLSEAAAARVVEAATALDPRSASLEAMAARTGLAPEALVEALRLEGVDLTRASAEDLSRRLGLSAEEAGRLVAAREAGNRLDSVERLAAAGLTQEVARRVHELARGSTLASASLEDMRRLGLSDAEAQRLVNARARVSAAPTLNYDEIERQTRFKVKKWAQEVRLSEALLRSLLPRANPAATTVTSATEGEGEGFGRTRRGPVGPVETSRVSYETVSSIFEAIREGAATRLGIRAGEVTDAEGRATLERGLEDVSRLRLEIVETNDILADHNAERGRVRISTGLLNELYARAQSVPPAERAAFRARALALVFGHEAAHASGVSVERMADAEAVEIVNNSRLRATGPLGEAEVRATVGAFDRPLGSSWIDSFFNRLRNFTRYGTTTGRVENLERAVRGEQDPLARYRRADGTLRWQEVIRNRALHEGAGLAHFGLALFLKEVAVVAATGDRARIEEFFDGLMTTDFYKHYGLFVAGARVGEVAYTRYLQQYIKPRFVNGMLKTNLVLAAGIALPLIVEGNFEGKAFAISLSSLGLSSAAVKAGVQGIRWVTGLKEAQEAGRLARFGLAGRRLMRFGGWFYTAAELAVVLFVAEKIEGEVNEYLDRRAALAELAAAGEAFLDAASDPDATAESLAAASDAYHEAWIEYRNFLYGPLYQDEAVLAARLEGLARQAKIKADERAAAIARLNQHASLRRNIERRYGSVEAYAEHLTREDEAEIERQVNTYVNSYNLTRDQHLEEVYRGNRRSEPLLADVDHLDWLLTGGQTGAAGDPYGARRDAFAELGRNRARAGLTDALKSASENRIQAYDDEAEVLASVATLLRGRGRGDLANVLDERRGLVLVLKDADQQLIDGNGLIDLRDREGLIDRVKTLSESGGR